MNDRGETRLEAVFKGRAAGSLGRSMLVRKEPRGSGEVSAQQRLTYFGHINHYVFLQVNRLIMDSSHSYILRYSHK